jgi:hypothetical protein
MFGGTNTTLLTQGAKKSPATKIAYKMLVSNGRNTGCFTPDDYIRPHKKRVVDRPQRNTPETFFIFYFEKNHKK